MLDVELTPAVRAPISELGESAPVGVIGVLSKSELLRSEPLAAVKNSLKEGKIFSLDLLKRYLRYQQKFQP